MEVVVRDLHGHAVNGLRQTDFQLTDNGNPQSLTSLQTEVRSAENTIATSPDKQMAQSRTPISDRYVALLFDDIHLQSPDMQHVRIAATRFVNDGVREGDRIAVFTTSGEDSLDFTTDRQKILNLIAHMQARPKQSEAGEPGCPRVRVHDAFLIAEQHDPAAYDTVFKQTKQCYCLDLEMPCDDTQIDELIKQQAERTWQQTRQLSLNSIGGIEGVTKYISSRRGNRVLVLASVGFLIGSTEGVALDHAIDAAVHAGVVVNSLDAKGLYAETPGGTVDDLSEIHSADAMSDPTGLVQQVESLGSKLGNLARPMVSLSASTGGLWFHNNNDFNAGYRMLAAAPEVAYILSFSVAQNKPDGSFHRLKVKVNVPGSHSIQARPGYFAVKPSAAQPTDAEKVDSAMQSSDQRNDLPLDLKTYLGVSTPLSSEVVVLINVDLKGLKDQEQKGRHVQKLTFAGALFGVEGGLVTGKEAEMDLALKPSNFDHYRQKGIQGKLSLNAPPGDYHLRIVVEEGIEGKMTAMTRDVRIP